jgi:hypothetical protein
MDDLEILLKRQELIANTPKNELDIITSKNIKTKKQTSEKSASLFDLIKMINKLVSLTMPNVVFIPDEGKVIETEAMKKIENPIITYKLISRVPKGELKSRVRDTIEETTKDGEKRLGEVCGQKYECLIQFNIFASVYDEAEEVMEHFEELMMSYTGFFKKNGIAEIFFKKQFTDDNYINLRETLSVRNLCYYVEIEKLTVIFREKIKEIELLAQIKEEI